MTEQQPEPSADEPDQDAEPASRPAGAAGADEHPVDQDAEPASEPLPEPPA